MVDEFVEESVAFNAQEHLSIPTFFSWRERLPELMLVAMSQRDFSQSNIR
jgi:hypothetical protein